MTPESTQLLAEALKRVTVSGTFCPIEIGGKIGLSKPQAETAARALSNAGVLVLGFDMAAEFSPDYRKMHVATRAKQPARKQRA